MRKLKIQIMVGIVILAALIWVVPGILAILGGLLTVIGGILIVGVLGLWTLVTMYSDRVDRII